MTAHGPTAPWRATLAATIAVASSTLGGCALDGAIAREQAYEMGHAPPGVLASVDQLLPGTVAWYREAERVGLALGQPLDADGLRLAREVGVASPDKVRLVVGHPIPPPGDPATLSRLYLTFGKPVNAYAATTFGYAIYVDRHDAGKRWLLAHELTHVAQVERLGMESFAHDYLLEMMLFGHGRSPMEIQARANEHLGR